MRKLSETQLSSFVSLILDKNIKDLDLFVTLAEMDIKGNFEPRSLGSGFKAKIDGLRGEVSIYRSHVRFSEEWTEENGYTISSQLRILQCDNDGNISKDETDNDYGSFLDKDACDVTLTFRRCNVKLEDIESTLSELKQSYERMVDLIDDDKIDKSNRQSEAVRDVSTLADVLKKPETKIIEAKPLNHVGVEPLKDEVVKPVEK